MDGGTFIGIAAASPEVTINAVSAYRNAGDIGLGVILGSGMIGIPLTITVAYLATRKRGVRSGDGASSSSSDGGTGSSGSPRAGQGSASSSQRSQSSQANATSSGDSRSEQGGSEHGKHRQAQLLRVSRDATWVLTLPYLGILAVVAALTLPARGATCNRSIVGSY